MRVGPLPRGDAAIFDGLEGLGAVVEGKAEGLIQVDVGDAGAVVGQAAVKVLLVRGGHLARMLGREEAAVGGRLELAGCLVDLIGFAGKSVAEGAVILRRTISTRRLASGAAMVDPMLRRKGKRKRARDGFIAEIVMGNMSVCYNSSSMQSVVPGSCVRRCRES